VEERDREGVWTVGLRTEAKKVLRRESVDGNALRATGSAIRRVMDGRCRLNVGSWWYSGESRWSRYRRLRLISWIRHNFLAGLSIGLKSIFGEDADEPHKNCVIGSLGGPTTTEFPAVRDALHTNTLLYNAKRCCMCLKPLSSRSP